MLRVLGVSAERGRILSAGDDARGGGPDGPVAVISHRFWQRRFGGADDIIGRRLTVERRSFTIVGVAPRSFFGLDVGRALDVMLPLGTEALIRGQESLLDRPSTWWLEIGGRLKPGQTIEQAQAGLQAIQPQVRAATIPARYPPQAAEQYLSVPLTLSPAGNGQFRAAVAISAGAAGHQGGRRARPC